MSTTDPQTAAPEDAPVPRQSSRRGGTVSNLDRGGSPAGTRPIAGMKAGWFFRESDRMILHRSRSDGAALPIGTVLPVVGRITYRMSDRRHTRIAYQLETAEGLRIVSAEEVLDGTWADRAGRDRPVNADEKHAYARIMSEDVRAADERPALPVKDAGGGLALPDVDAQELGYLRTSDPDQSAAYDAWRRLMGMAASSERTTLGLSAMFSGPLISSLKGTQAHILNLTGSGQIGKSTTQRIMCALMGDPGDSYELFGSMNNTGLFLPEVLIEARYLPMCREETSSSAMSLPELEKLFSRIVAGAKRGRLGQGGSRKQSAGTWHSIFVTSSNESLLRAGQVESLASRLMQLQAPFFNSADDGMLAWELASQFHGWPLVWAREADMFTAARVAEWRRLHGEIVSRMAFAEAIERGGIPLSLVRIVAAWCVGGYMLGELLGMPELGAKAEEDARTELPRILGDVAQTHLSPGQVLWETLAGAIAQEPAAWVQSSVLDPQTWSAVEFKPRRVLGYYHAEHPNRIYVYVATLKDAAKTAGLDTTVPGLKDLQERGVLITEERTKYASKHPTREMRAAIPGRVYVFDTSVAQEAFADRETPPPVVPGVDDVPVPADDSATVASEQRAMDAWAKVRDGQAAEPVHAAVASRDHDATNALAAQVVQAPPVPTSPPTVHIAATAVVPAAVCAYPPARVADGADRAWLGLESRVRGRSRSALNFGVLGDGVLHLPAHDPVAVPMPGSVDDVPALMDAYGLKTLWLHDQALSALGLPTFAQRREDYLAGKPEGTRGAGPQTPTPHPWATPGDGSPVAQMAPEGLATWMTLILHSDDRRAPRLSVAIPAYDNRLDRAKQPGRGGFGGAPTPESLLDALMVWSTATVHGPKENPKVIPYYLSVNRTGEDFAGGRVDRDGNPREDVLCRAVRRGEVPPALRNAFPTMVPQKWQRPADELTEAERSAAWVQEYDKSAAWLAAYSNVKLGIGEPVHAASGLPYDKRCAGFWRVADVPGHGPAGLPPLAFREAEGGGYWVATPSMDVLRELYPKWEPQVLEAYYWPDSKRALEGMYKLLHAARESVLAAAEDGRPGAKWAKQVLGGIYQSFRGYLGRTSGPQTDFTTGADYEDDVFYRPDWALMLLTHATANTYRNLVTYWAKGAGPAPLYVNVDAVGYPANEADPELAKPDRMVLGGKGGQWTAEGTVPMREMLPVFTAGSSVHVALETYLTEQDKES